MTRLGRLAGWAAWAVISLWAAWCFWRPILLGWSIPRRPAIDPEYGIRLVALSPGELAAARAREAAVQADMEAFADAG